jgi:hypothetical protein
MGFKKWSLTHGPGSPGDLTTKICKNYRINQTGYQKMTFDEWTNFYLNGFVSQFADSELFKYYDNIRQPSLFSFAYFAVLILSKKKIIAFHNERRLISEIIVEQVKKHFPNLKYTLVDRANISYLHNCILFLNTDSSFIALDNDFY